MYRVVNYTYKYAMHEWNLLLVHTDTAQHGPPHTTLMWLIVWISIWAASSCLALHLGPNIHVLHALGLALRGMELHKPITPLVLLLAAYYLVIFYILDHNFCSWSKTLIEVSRSLLYNKGIWSMGVHLMDFSTVFKLWIVWFRKFKNFVVRHRI
jgi:hypothetical protein